MNELPTNLQNFMQKDVTEVNFGKPRAAGCMAGGSCLFPATRTDDRCSTGLASTGTSDDSQTCMHCQQADTRRLAQLDTIRPAAAASACIDWLR